MKSLPPSTARWKLLRHVPRLVGTLLVALPGLSAHAAPKEGLPGFLDKHCISCHNPEKKKGKLDLSPVVASPEKTDSGLLIMMLDALKNGDMPPEDKRQPTPAEKTGALRVLDTLLLTSAAAPGQGNLVDHKTLFTEPAVRRAATPARLWRMSPHIFMQYANGLTRSRMMNTDGGREGGDGMHPAFAYMTPLHTFRDAARIHLFEDATSELLFDVCWEVAGGQLSDKGKGMKPVAIRAILMAKPPTPKMWADAIQTQFDLAIRREASAEEVSGLVALGEKTLKDTEVFTAVQTVLATILLRPDAVYRYEIGRGSPDALGRVRLADEEVARAISFALTDAGPDAAMLAALKAGELAKNEGVLAQVNRLLNDKVSQPRRVRFFREYFEYPRVVEVFKDKSYPTLILAEQRITDADRLVTYILDDDRAVLRRLLTEDKLFAVSDGGLNNGFFKSVVQKNYLPDYDIPSDWDWKGSQPVKPAVGRRSGMLTNPVWLLTFSDNEKNQAIQRGRWIYTKLLGGNIPDTPIGVNAVLSSDPKKTLRERMEVTREEYCWRCHQRMDPLGLPLEQFNDFGRWRDTEVGKPVVTTGEIKIGDPALDGPVKDPYEMMERLAASERVEQVFARHVFRYLLGRNETPDDAPTLIDAHQAYRKSGGSFRALVASILTSDSFLLRTR